MVTEDTKIAILGGRGMLGSDLTSICESQGFRVEVFDLPEFDITDPRQLQEALNAAQMIVNCAAYTNGMRANGSCTSARILFLTAARIDPTSRPTLRTP
ncbi:MAG: hypothetical protein AMJ75_08210 [Phycisphaerae bacterium SM1_79]|nr:MAG: hypothetical protein AMJ75_08210 [Phycisphaerae bacterium SM1_79]